MKNLELGSKAQDSFNYKLLVKYYFNSLDSQLIKQTIKINQTLPFLKRLLSCSRKDYFNKKKQEFSQNAIQITSLKCILRE